MNANVKKDKWKYLLILSFLINLIFHLPFITLDIQGIHSWRQSQTMSNVRNFVRHDNNILNPRTNKFNSVTKDNLHRYEFPILQWSIAQIQTLFGEHILIARLIILLISILTSIGLYLICRLIFYDRFIAFSTTVLFQFSPCFFYYSINPLPDCLALASSTWYVYFILMHHSTSAKKYLLLACFALLLTTLAKLPFIIFGVVSLSLFIQKEWKHSPWHYIITHLLLIIPALAWYAWVIPTWTGNPILHGVFGGNNSILFILDILKYHLTWMFPFLLLSPLVWIPLWLGMRHIAKTSFKELSWMKSLIAITIIYLILQFNTIGKVHDYYMFPFLLWLYLIIGFGIQTIIKHNVESRRLIYLIVILSPIYTLVFNTNSWSVRNTYFNPDVINNRTLLKLAVPQSEKCIILNDPSGYIFGYAIDKMGYVFAKDEFNPIWLEDIIQNYDVHYMYSDSESVNTNPITKSYIEEELLQVGSVHVYKLKAGK